MIRQGYTLHVMNEQSNYTDMFVRLGKLATNSVVFKDLEGAITHTYTHIWFFVDDENGKTVGVSSINTAKNTTWFDNAWVSHDNRCNGIYTYMLHCRLAYAKDNGILSVRSYAKPSTHGILEKHGFICVAQRGKWKTYQKDLI
jgi:hypothetical protein